MTKECFLRALQRHRERVIYAFGWAVVLLSPFLMMYFRSRNSSEPLPWGFYGAVWATMGLFLVFFLFHNRFVAPLFFRPRKSRYFIFAFLLVLLLGVFQYLTFPLFGPPPPEKRSRHEVIVRDKEGKTVRGVEVRVLRFAKPGIVERVDLASLFILTLMFGVNLGVKIYFRSEDTSRELMLLQQEKLSNQLKYLKAQINPHFFFNSLNSLAMLVREKHDEKALTYIDQLSYTFRYIIQNGQSMLMTLDEELKFLEAYSYLFKIRYADKLFFDIDVDEKYLGWKLPAFSLQPLIDNAVKHNSITRTKPFHISVRTEEGLLVVSNPKVPKLEPEPSTGIGLENLRNRWNLITGSDIEIVDDGATFSVRMPLQNPSV